MYTAVLGMDSINDVYIKYNKLNLNICATIELVYLADFVVG